MSAVAGVSGGRLATRPSLIARVQWTGDRPRRTSHRTVATPPPAIQPQAISWSAADDPAEPRCTSINASIVASRARSTNQRNVAHSRIARVLRGYRPDDPQQPAPPHDLDQDLPVVLTDGWRASFPEARAVLLRVYNVVNQP